MKPTIALLMTAGLLAFSYALEVVTGLPITWGMLIATAGWAAYDSTQIGLRRYKTGLSYHPVVLFLAVAMLWIVGFPWYLIVRYKITTGRAELKAVSGEHASPPIQ